MTCTYNPFTLEAESQTDVSSTAVGRNSPTKCG